MIIIKKRLVEDLKYKATSLSKSSPNNAIIFLPRQAQCVRESDGEIVEGETRERLWWRLWWRCIDFCPW